MEQTDYDIEAAIEEQLCADSRFESAQICIAVDNGVATLSGEVKTYEQKHAAMQIARQTPGARGVADDLLVHVISAHRRPEEERAGLASVTARLEMN
jgi:osmotically-inducible protein OsmY